MRVADGGEEEGCHCISFILVFQLLFFLPAVYLFLFPTPAALSNVLHGDVDIILSKSVPCSTKGLS